MADLIDRKAALDICDEYNGHGYVWLCIRGKIEQLPSEVRKTGRWKPYPIADGCIQCSVCGILRVGEPSNYCPNCGADMRGEHDE